MQSLAVVRLPPRPRVADWAYAGASAGIILGASEVLVAYLARSPVPPPIALLVVLANAVLVGVLSGLLGVVARATRQRASHSAMIGATLGPLLGAAIVGALWRHGVIAESRSVLALSGLATALMLSVAISLMAMRLCDALERSAVFPNGPFVWLLAALPLANAERALASGTRPASSLAALVGAPLLAAVIAVAALAWARRRGSRVPRRASRTFALLTLAAVAATFLPWAAPWLLSDPQLPALDEEGPPNILVVALGAAPASAVAGWEAGLAPFASSSVIYENIEPHAPSGVFDLLTTPSGASVPSQLAANSYAVSLILTDRDRAPALEGVDVDSAPGAAELLATSLGWMASASLLAGPGRPLLSTLGLGTSFRAPEQIAAAAKRWLTAWRMNRARVPFFLYVDFGAREEIDRFEAAEAALFELLDQLEMLDVDRRTAILVVSDLHSPNASDPHSLVGAAPGSAAHFTALLRPAASWLELPRGVRVSRTIPSRELGAALLEMADRKPRTGSRTLPGLSDVAR